MNARGWQVVTVIGIVALLMIVAISAYKEIRLGQEPAATPAVAAPAGPMMTCPMMRMRPEMKGLGPMCGRPLPGPEPGAVQAPADNTVMPHAAP